MCTLRHGLGKPSLKRVTSCFNIAHPNSHSVHLREVRLGAKMNLPSFMWPCSCGVQGKPFTLKPTKDPRNPLTNKGTSFAAWLLSPLRNDQTPNYYIRPTSAENPKKNLSILKTIENRRKSREPSGKHSSLYHTTSHRTPFPSTYLAKKLYQWLFLKMKREPSKHGCE